MPRDFTLRDDETLTIGRFTLKVCKSERCVWVEDLDRGDGGDFPASSIGAMLKTIRPNAPTAEAEATVAEYYTKYF